MNTNAIKIIALTLSISAISSVVPSALNINTTTVMAATDVKGIESLKVCKGDSTNSLTLYKDSDFKNSTKFKDSVDKYYVRLPESNGKFNIDGDAKSGYKLKVFQDGKEYDLGKTISVSEGDSESVKVKVYDEDDAVVSTVTIKVTREGDKKSSKSDDDYIDDDDIDDVYLNDIKIKSDEEKIDFIYYRSKNKFSLEVGERVDSVKITAKPDNDDDVVRIDGSKVTDDDDYAKDISLNIGENIVKISVKNDDKDEREYTLKITRKGDKSLTISSNSNASTSDGKILATGIDIADSSFYDSTVTSNSALVEYNNSSTNAKNKWVKNGFNWQYFDNSGNALKNEWLKDESDGKWYYFQTNAYMTTGWRFIDGSWYYFDKTGYMISNKWLKNTNGKWYYLTKSGEMAKNTTIDGYVLNARGEMIE